MKHFKVVVENIEAEKVNVSTCEDKFPSYEKGNIIAHFTLYLEQEANPYYLDVPHITIPYSKTIGTEFHATMTLPYDMTITQAEEYITKEIETLFKDDIK